MGHCYCSVILAFLKSLFLWSTHWVWFFACYADTFEKQSLYLGLCNYQSNGGSMQTEIHGNVKRLCKLKLLLLNKCRHANFTSAQGTRRKINAFQIYISVNMLKCISVFFCLKLWFLVCCGSQCTENYEQKLNNFLPEKDRRALLKNIFSFKFLAYIWNSLLHFWVYRFLRMWSLKHIWFMHFIHWNIHFM